MITWSQQHRKMKTPSGGTPLTIKLSDLLVNVYNYINILMQLTNLNQSKSRNHILFRSKSGFIRDKYRTLELTCVSSFEWKSR